MKTWQKAKRGAGCCGEREETAARVRVADRNPAHYPYSAVLDIGGMTCANCARKVENALNGQEGVLAKVSIASHQATLRTKNPPDERQLRQAVQDPGYVVLRYENTGRG